MALDQLIGIGALAISSAGIVVFWIFVYVDGERNSVAEELWLGATHLKQSNWRIVRGGARLKSFEFYDRLLYDFRGRSLTRPLAIYESISARMWLFRINIHKRHNAVFVVWLPEAHYPNVIVTNKGVSSAGHAIQEVGHGWNLTGEAAGDSYVVDIVSQLRTVLSTIQQVKRITFSGNYIAIVGGDVARIKNITPFIRETGQICAALNLPKGF